MTLEIRIKSKPQNEVFIHLGSRLCLDDGCVWVWFLFRPAGLFEKCSLSWLNEQNFFLFQLCKDLVKRMLNLDPRQRISSSNILKHPWITNIEQLPDIKLAIQDGDHVKVSAWLINNWLWQNNIDSPQNRVPWRLHSSCLVQKIFSGPC